MYKLIGAYGGENFLRKFFREVATRPSAVTTQDAVDNFVVAASSAAGQNLVPLFKDRWRLPVSKGAIKDLSKQWSGMTKALQPDP
jgi:hypothetical protein